MVLSLGETPVKRISTKYLSFKNVHYAIFCKQTRSCHSLFVNAYVLPLNFLCYESVLNLMHDTDERNAPINILNLFSGTSNSHYFNSTLSSTQNFYIKKSRRDTPGDMQKNAFSRVGARKDVEWDAKFSLKNISRKTFRKKLNLKQLY